MLTNSIYLKNFKKKKNFLPKTIKNLKQLFNDKSEVIKSLSSNYRPFYDKKEILKKYKNYKQVRLIGMGGSIMGAKAIHSFLNHKIKKNFYFVDNLESNSNLIKKKKFS